MESWKIIPESVDETMVDFVPFLQSRKYFAVDDSGSTAGAILRQERGFVDAFQTFGYATPADSISLWGTSCDAPTNNFSTVRWRSTHGGTTPSAILTTTSALNAIKRSDLWLLLTDGEIWSNDVHRLADLALAKDVLNVPLVFLITGARGKTPSSTNISVGISFFASAEDTLILFKETSTGLIYVIAGKGCFAALGGSAAAQDLERWDDLQVFAGEEALFEHLQKMEIQVQTANTRAGSAPGVSLGPEWEARHGGPTRVNLDLLPKAGVLSDDDIFALLADEAFDTLAVAYKTRSRTAELRGFLQKQKFEQVAPKLEDIAGASTIISKMTDKDITAVARKELQEQLRAAHTRNRDHYQKSNADFAGSEKEQKLKQRNKLIDAALQSLASIEAAGFNAEILSRRSNRARRAEAVGSTPAIEVTQLDLQAPSCKGYCFVCCGEEEIMSICFKETDPDKRDDNTTDFALNFPLAAGASAKNINLISSQNICFQCAIAMEGSRSVFQEELRAVIPVVQYTGSNKKYINDQLYLALTARLATGAAGISQLFMAILQQLMDSKSWAGAGLDTVRATGDEEREAFQRRVTFQWMLDQLVQNTYSREDFKETGAWVPYQDALKWTAEDFGVNGLASFAVTYPAAGFDILLSIGRHYGAYAADTVQRLRSGKAIHSIASKYLAELQTALTGRSINGSGFDEHWKQKYLEVIYQDFNGPLIPTDQGTSSLVTDVNTFTSRLAACIDSKTLTAELEGDHLVTVMRKIQIILFWLLFHQRGHCTAQTFFTNMRSTHALATVVLDANPTSVPETEHNNLLLSFFARHEGHLIDPSAAKQHITTIPFANPFSASVLHCGAPQCNTPFCPSNDATHVTPKLATTTRDARTKHLIQVFGIQTRFENSQTGLPERPITGAAPSSIHTNLHVSIAREWARHTQNERRAIVADDTAREAFIKRVRMRLCIDGRGNIFQSELDRDTRELLPSFFAVLATALEMQGKDGGDVSAYEHDFSANKMESKIEWELRAGASVRCGKAKRKLSMHADDDFVML